MKKKGQEKEMSWANVTVQRDGKRGCRKWKIEGENDSTVLKQRKKIKNREEMTNV